ncbi:MULTISPECIES: hypothetical protein [unclassified Bradyrhizobium]|uniref:hypothetical protein n=1 Tax=unclassified Bradyrhizobium TaxID=2631580 RepID=UPI0028EFF167|nr:MULTISPECIES: hypothetical protein [unclassified Bradyrhizobium]
MKRKLDIEKLLQWAVRDELPKGRAVAADVGFAIGRREVRPFAIARSLGRARDDDFDSMGYVPGEPHADAQIVADAIGALATSVTLECADDARALFGDFAPIAEHVIPSLMLAVWNPQAIVLAGAMGKRPSWQFKCPTPYQMFAPTAGRPRPIVHGINAAGELVELRRNEGRARKRDGEYTLAMSPRSPLDWHEPAPLHIGECRAEWVTWCNALDDLSRALAGKLATIEVQPRTAASMPWCDGSSAPRVLAGRKLTLADVELGFAPRRNAFAGKPVESPIEAETVKSYARASRQKMRKSAAI